MWLIRIVLLTSIGIWLGTMIHYSFEYLELLAATDKHTSSDEFWTFVVATAANTPLLVYFILQHRPPSRKEE